MDHLFSLSLTSRTMVSMKPIGGISGTNAHISPIHSHPLPGPQLCLQDTRIFPTFRSTRDCVFQMQSPPFGIFFCLSSGKDHRKRSEHKCWYLKMILQFLLLHTSWWPQDTQPDTFWRIAFHWTQASHLKRHVLTHSVEKCKWMSEHSQRHICQIFF